MSIGNDHPVTLEQAAARIASGDNEATAAPWWAILCPHKLGSRPGYRTVHLMGSAIIGPFFSREDAEQHRQARIHDYGETSSVYCLSGYHSGDYHDFADAVVRSTWKLRDQVAELEKALEQARAALVDIALANAELGKKNAQLQTQVQNQKEEIDLLNQEINVCQNALLIYADQGNWKDAPVRTAVVFDHRLPNGYPVEGWFLAQQTQELAAEINKKHFYIGEGKQP